MKSFRAHWRPRRPAEATDHRVEVGPWTSLVATCGLSLPSSIWCALAPDSAGIPLPKLIFPVYSLTK